jgi:hypothetical protein
MQASQLKGVPALVLPLISSCLATDPALRPSISQALAKLKELHAQVTQKSGLAVLPPVSCQWAVVQ